MTRTKKLIIAGAVAAVVAVPAVAVSAQTIGGTEGPDVAITGEALDQASAAALAYVGEGQVTETEIEDEESYYEVEVTRADGSQVDVQLDESFTVVGSEEDGADDAADDAVTGT